MNDRYESTLLDDFYGDLKITQNGLVHDYQGNRWSANKAGSLREQQQVSCFISGLKKTIPHAVGLARLYKYQNKKRKSPFNPEHKGINFNPTSQNSQRYTATPNQGQKVTTPPIKRVTAKEKTVGIATYAITANEIYTTSPSLQKAIPHRLQV